MKLFKNLKRYIHANLIWLSRIWGLWGVVLPLALLFFIIFLPWDLDNLIRYVGLALELLGIITVAIGLKGKRELFKKPSFIEHIRNWWNQRPAWKPVIISGSVAAMSGGVSCSARGSTWHGPIDDTVESRLEAAEKIFYHFEVSCKLSNKIPTLNIPNWIKRLRTSGKQESPQYMRLGRA